MKKLYVLIICLCTGYLSMSQQVVSSAGHSGTGANTSITYSVGELAVSSYDSQNTSVHEGIIQNFLEATIQIEQLPNIQLHVFPNPVQTYLQIQSSQHHEYEYVLTNIQGEIIETQSFIQNHTVPFISRTPGTYLLQVRELQTQKMNTYTIIKK
ncbi:MAG TPA: T9SS type A sorting domain-containing protein [Bacteroidales bacterium]|nr:T9SS type A sorting domain-containing protein [Bacteroidales bacterium]